MDDTKEEADAGSFGMLVVIRSGTGLPTSKFVGLMEDVLLKVAERVVEEERHLMGHIKAFVTTPEGTLKLNIVDLDLGVETMNRLQGGTVPIGRNEVHGGDSRDKGQRAGRDHGKEPRYPKALVRSGDKRITIMTSMMDMRTTVRMAGPKDHLACNDGQPNVCFPFMQTVVGRACDQRS